MDFSNKLNISQGLRHELGLKLTPEMRLRLDVLQATNLELMGILNNELSENPVLDDLIDDDEDQPVKEEIIEHKDETEDLKMSENDSHTDEYDSGDYENVFENDDYDIKSSPPDYNPEMGKFDDYKYNSMRYEEKKDLSSELIRQLNEAGLPDDLYLAVMTLISNLDEKGFLQKPTSEICAESGISVDTMHKAMEIMQTFEPAGAGTADTKECLLIQLKLKGLKDSLAYQIVEKGFDHLARQNYAKLASMLKVKEEDIKNGAEAIKELYPYPGSSFASGDNDFVVPDIFVTEEDGKYAIKVPSNFPEIRINKKYLRMYKEKAETKEFIKSYEIRVKALMKALEERNITIENVIKKIIAIQEGYLNNEDAGLKPLTYKEIASETGVSESTVSRIVSRKYIQLPTGVYPLKKFFTTGIETTNGGGSMSNSVIRSKIKDIIEAEDKKNPVNDTELEQILKEQGIPVARRTVTKYREQL
jgi:RNA polymerase sigma-54 factor